MSKKRPIRAPYEIHTLEEMIKKDIPMLLPKSLFRVLAMSEAFHESQTGQHEREKGLFQKDQNC